MRDGDLVGIIEVFELSGEVRNFTDAEMVRDAPIMLDRNALPYYGPMRLLQNYFLGSHLMNSVRTYCRKGTVHV